MKTFLYIVWFSIPLFFFGVALFATLERLGGKEKKGGTADAWRQGFFVLACVGVAVLIDRTVLPDIVDSIAPDYLPLGFFEVILLPLVLYLAALLFGGSKEILIGQAPKPTRGKRKR
ncbi:MAG: hypothetical protein J0M12_10170 [Deltaproteobacteria bacterium]|nr:hypothetical protein [Deltaproteobacteria bacterium]